MDRTWSATIVMRCGARALLKYRAGVFVRSRGVKRTAAATVCTGMCERALKGNLESTVKKKSCAAVPAFIYTGKLIFYMEIIADITYDSI